MFRDLLAAAWADYGNLSEAQLAALESHYRLMLRWNYRINLTRSSSLLEMVQLHYCESMFLGLLLPRGQLKILDFGSGAGFPGIPLAIVRPECTVVLAEANRRKAVFLREASRGIPNVSVTSDRQEMGQQSYDWVVSRAVAPNEVLKSRLAPRFAILTSLRSLEGLPKPVELTPIPWGAQRVIAMFHVEHSPC